MTAPAVQPPPRERAPAQYEQLNEQRYRQQNEDELNQKHDRRSHLRLGRGKFLILSAPEGLEYQIGLTNGGLLTVTNNTTGAVGDFVVDWDTVDGAAARDLQIAALESSVAGIPGIYATITALATVESTLEGSIATLSTTLTAAYQAADATLQTDINTRATSAALTTESTARANADSALATDITNLTATVGTNTANVSTNAGAIATINGAAAFYDIIVAASGGNPARIGLRSGAAGSQVLIEGDQVYLGAQTEFDTTTETFITEAGGVRTRYGAPFGASSDLLRWYGPTSVAQNAETKTNGYLAEGTDGVLYIGNAPVGWGATAAEAAASNARVPVGANACVDSAFERDLYAWQAGWAGNQGQPHAVTKNTYGAAARHYYVANVTGTPTAGTIFDVLATKGTYLSTDLANTKLFGMPVAPGERVYAAAQFTGEHISAVSTQVLWLDKDGVTLSASSAGSALPTGQALAAIASWDRIGGFLTAPANTAFAAIFFRATCDGTANPYCAVTAPMLARVPAIQTEPPPYVPGRPDPIGDQTGTNTASAITGQGVWATGNYYEQTSDPGSVPNGSFWFKTDTNEFYVRRSGAWGKVATIANQNITISRTNGFVKTRIGAGTITSDSVSFSSTGGSGTGYTYAHELFPTYTTGPTPTISSASGSPITASASGAVPGDEVRGFVQTTVTDSAGNKTTLTSPVALFCES